MRKAEHTIPTRLFWFRLFRSLCELMIKMNGLKVWVVPMWNVSSLKMAYNVMLTYQIGGHQFTTTLECTWKLLINVLIVKIPIQSLAYKSIIAWVFVRDNQTSKPSTNIRTRSSKLIRKSVQLLSTIYLRIWTFIHIWRKRVLS